VKLFISYCHDDEAWRKRVCAQLMVLERAAGLIELWDDQKLMAGENWRSRLDQELLSAKIAVLLISASFLGSEFIIEHEVLTIFDQHAASGMTIYPLLIKPCDWQDVPWLANIQIRPANGKALASFRTENAISEVLASCAREIAAIARTAA
jgi:hypothetical protein